MSHLSADPVFRVPTGMVTVVPGIRLTIQSTYYVTPHCCVSTVVMGMSDCDIRARVYNMTRSRWKCWGKTPQAGGGLSYLCSVAIERAAVLLAVHHQPLLIRDLRPHNKTKQEYDIVF